MKKLCTTISLIGLLIVPTAVQASTSTQHRLAMLEKLVRGEHRLNIRLTKRVDVLTKKLSKTTETADTAIQAVQCTYELPFQWKPTTETFHPLGIDQVDDQTMWFVFGATGSNCGGTDLPPYSPQR